MADGDQNQQPPRYWFPYWTGAPQPPPQPPVRPQPSRRLAPPSPSQHHQPAFRGAAPPTPPQASSRPSLPRASTLAPIPEPPPPNDSNAGGTVAAPAKPPPKTAVLILPAVPEAAPTQKDIHVLLPPAAAETIKPHGHGHGKPAADKELKAHHHKEDHKSKDKEKKDETKSKEKEKKKHHAHADEDSKHREAEAEHGKLLHGDITAGLADMVHRATGARSASGHPATSIITLAGENKGASMNVGGGKERHGGHRLDDDGTKSAGNNNKQGTMTPLINSNVQAVNNSLLLQSSCSGGDLKLSAKSAAKDKQKHAAAGDKEAAVAAKK